MTIKKTLISVAASALLIAAMTGCSDDDDNDSGSKTGIQGSVNAVDGYIYNAEVKAYYLEDDNKTMSSVDLVAAKSTKALSDNKWTVGGKDYALADANKSIKSKIKFFQLTAVKSDSDTGVFIAPTYIESDGIAGYDANDTLLVPGFVLNAPANGAVISPLSSMVYELVKAEIGTTAGAGTVTTDLNASFMTSVEGNASKLAKQLGLGDANIMTQDPIAAQESNPTFALVNAMYKNDATNANVVVAVMKAAPAKSLEDTMAVVKNTAQDAAVQVLAGNLEAGAKEGSFKIADIAKINIDQSVSKGVVQNAKVIDTTSNIRVGSILVDTKNTSSLLDNGDKLKNDFVSSLKVGADKDNNITNKSFKLLVSIQGTASSVADKDNNASSGIAFSIPFELNATDGVVGVTLTPADMIKYEIQSSFGSDVVSGDLNVSTAKIKNDVITTNGHLAFGVADIATKVSKAVEGNITSGNYNLDLNKLSKVQVVLIDSDNVMTRVNKDDQVINFAKDTFASLLGTMSGEGIRLIDLDRADLRGDETGANVAPDNNLSFSGVVSGEGNVSNPFIVNSETSVDVSSRASTTNTEEVNTTISFTDGLYIEDINSSSLSTQVKADSKSNASQTKAFDFNATSKPTGELNTTITTVVTDEFGEANSTKYYFTVNRAPSYVKSMESNDSTYNNASFKVLEDLDGNTIDNVVLVVTIDDKNVSFNTSDTNVTENIEATGSKDTNGSIDVTLLKSDDNTTVTLSFNTDLNMSENWFAKHVMIKSTDTNDSYDFGVELTERNITISE